MTDYEEQVAEEAIEEYEEISEEAEASEEANELPEEADEEPHKEEVEEMEFDEDDIVGYIVDEDDNEIGIIVLENGEEVEYYYAEETETSAPASNNNDIDFGITRQGVASATKDVNAIARDGIKVANEFKGAFDDIKSALDFKSMFK